MLKAIVLFSLFSFLVPSLSLAQANDFDKVCFPISRSKHDWKCHDFESQADCLNQSDEYTCGWGHRGENALTDEEQLICEDSRCADLEDDTDSPDSF